MGTKNLCTSNTSQGASSQITTTVARSLPAAAFDHTFAADVFIAVIAAVLRSTISRANVILAVTATVHFADATFVKVVFLLRLRRHDCRSRRFLSTDKWLALVSYFFFLHEFVVRFLLTNDDLLRLATLFSYDHRLAPLLSYYDRRLRGWFSYDDGLGLLIVFSLLSVSLNLGLVVMMVWVMRVRWWVLSLALKSVLADSLLCGWRGCTNCLSISFWIVEVTAARRDVVALDHTVGYVAPGRFPFRYTLSDMPLVVATLVVPAIALGDAEVDLGAWLGRWRVISSFTLDDDLIVFDFVLLPWSVRDLVALDGGVWTAWLRVSFCLATALALTIDYALASDRHGDCLEVGGVCLGCVVGSDSPSGGLDEVFRTAGWRLRSRHALAASW
jgi:hypothetical protein